MDSPILSHDPRHKPGESRTSSRPGRPAVSGCFLTVPTCIASFNRTQRGARHRQASVK